jgi:hypothetical protein
LGQSFQEGGDTYQAQVAYSFAQSIEPKEEIAKKQSELKICLADTKTNKIPGEPFENWKAIWTTLHRDDTPEDMDADGDPDKPLWQPKNDEEARKDLCNCQGKGPWLIRTEHTDEAGYPPEGTHLIMPKGKKFVVFPWLGRYTSDEGDLGNLRIAEETSEEPKGVFRVRLDSQQSVDGQTIAEIKRELYFDIASQQQILAITRDAFPRIPATDYDTASEFTQFVKLSLKDGVVSLQGGGCNETIPIKK